MIALHKLCVCDSSAYILCRPSHRALKHQPYASAMAPFLYRHSAYLRYSTIRHRASIMFNAYLIFLFNKYSATKLIVCQAFFVFYIFLAISAASFALLNTSSIFDSRLFPPVISLTFASKNGVDSFPLIPFSSASFKASSIAFVIVS